YSLRLLFQFCRSSSCFRLFFFNATATSEIYTLSLHDALPISWRTRPVGSSGSPPTSVFAWNPVMLLRWRRSIRKSLTGFQANTRSEEHTSELQSLAYLVCRLLLEKKKNQKQH